MAETTRYRIVACHDGKKRKRCRSCNYVTELSRRSCPSCHKRFKCPPKRKQPKRGTEDRLKLDLAHAAKMADLWTTRAIRAVKTMHEWNRKERRITGRLAAGPQPPKPKRERPPRRAIRFAEKEQG